MLNIATNQIMLLFLFVFVFYHIDSNQHLLTFPYTVEPL